FDIRFYDLVASRAANVRSAPRSKAAFLFRNENFAFASMVGLSDDALKFHPLHQRCRTIAANLQPALNIAGRGLAIAFDDGDGLREQVAACVAAQPGGIEYAAA